MRRAPDEMRYCIPFVGTAPPKTSTARRAMGEGNGKRLLATARHVVDEGAIDVGTAQTDQIKEVVVVCDEVFLVGKFFVHHQGMTGFAQHHQAPRDPHCFSSGAPRHLARPILFEGP